MTDNATKSAVPQPAIPKSRLPRGFAALRHRNYRLFFAGHLVSVTGTWMQSVALAWLMLDLTDSPIVFSLIPVLNFAPVLFLGMVAGVIADRLPKRAILVGTQTSSAVIAGALTFLTMTDMVEIWHVLVLTLLLGVVNAFDMPTRQSFVVEMVGKDDLMNAIALNSSIFNGGRVIGPAIAGVMLGLAGPEWCFAVNAISYIPMTIGLMMMHLGPPPRARDQRGLAQMREGLLTVRSTPMLLLPTIMIGVVSIFGMNFQVWIPLLAKHEFMTDAGGFGVLMAALGVGSFAGAMFLAMFGRGGRPVQMLTAAAVLGLTEIVLAAYARIGGPLVPALLLLGVLGFTMSTSAATANTIIQSSSPEAMRGRVMAVYLTVFAGTAPAGSFLTGAMADRWSTPVSMAAGGVITILATGLIARWFRQVQHTVTVVAQSASVSPT